MAIRAAITVSVTSILLGMCIQTPLAVQHALYSRPTHLPNLFCEQACSSPTGLLIP
jgi:hypothetical protein